MRKNVEVGAVYERWTVISLNSVHAWHAICKCSCGTIREVRKASLNNGMSRSCGCLQKEVMILKCKIHGYVGTKAYETWNNMKRRCLNPKHPQYHLYGGRGIELCEKWMKFEGFLDDMGEPPSHATIDRIDNDLGYFKENCMWRSHKENCQNTRQSKRWHINGKIFSSITDAAKFFDVSKTTIYCWCNGLVRGDKFYPPKSNCWSELFYK